MTKLKGRGAWTSKIALSLYNTLLPGIHTDAQQVEPLSFTPGHHFRTPLQLCTIFSTLQSRFGPCLLKIRFCKATFGVVGAFKG